MPRLLTIIVLLCAYVPAFADARHDVKCREIGFSKSVEIRDAELFRSFIDADARFIGASVTKGIEAIVTRWSVFFTEEGPSIVWRPQFIEVLEDGKLALSRGPYKMLATDEDGNVSEYWGTFNSVWRLGEDSQWRVVFDAGNDSAEPPPDAIRALLDEADDCEPDTID
jgi:ketosteroid isomerase-like protein